jgi:protein involved in polysaccharide export with SLBB domain
MQPNDVILIPDRTNIVQVSGEVTVPQALVYIEGASLTDYIDRVGGYTVRADESKHLILRRNSEVLPLLDGDTGIKIMPGDEIIALPAIPGNSVEIIQLVTETIFRIAGAAAIFIGVN